MANKLEIQAEELTVMQLAPEDLLESPHSNVRPWELNKGATKKQQESLLQLANTIGAEGQLMNGVAMAVQNEETDETEYHLVDGRRRRKAIMLWNQNNPNDQRLMTVNVLFDVDPKAAFRKAMIANLQREDMNPMEIALDIKQMKESEGWTGNNWTIHAASALGVSRAYISQKMRLIQDLDIDTQSKVADGTLSEFAALAMLDVHPDKAAEVIEVATGKAQEEKSKKDAARVQSTPLTGLIDAILAPTTSTTVDIVRAEKAKMEAAKPPVVQQKHIVDAAREVEGALNKLKPRSRGDILSFFESQDSEVNGYHDAPVRVFCRYLIEEYAAGAGTDKTLQKRFDLVIENADLGTPESTQAQEDKEAKRLAKEVAEIDKKAKAKTKARADEKAAEKDRKDQEKAYLKEEKAAAKAAKAKEAKAEKAAKAKAAPKAPKTPKAVAKSKAPAKTKATAKGKGGSKKAA